MSDQFVQWLIFLCPVLLGFNAAVAGSFFAIETVLRPLRAENSPPFTTAMIILASVISSTVSNVLLGTQSAFTVPSYDLKSAAGIFVTPTLRLVISIIQHHHLFNSHFFGALIYACQNLFHPIFVFLLLFF